MKCGIRGSWQVAQRETQGLVIVLWNSVSVQGNPTNQPTLLCSWWITVGLTNKGLYIDFINFVFPFASFVYNVSTHAVTKYVNSLKKNPLPFPSESLSKLSFYEGSCCTVYSSEIFNSYIIFVFHISHRVWLQCHSKLLSSSVEILLNTHIFNKRNTSL